MLRQPWTLYFLAAVLAATAVRLPTALGVSLAPSEGRYALNAWRLLTGAGAPGAGYEAAPGYSQLLALVMFLLGASDASVLLLSALAGAAGVAACVALSRALGRPGAVLVALLLALSPVWVRLSTVAAPEQAAVCLALLAAGLFVSRGGRSWPLYAAGALTGYLCAFGPAGVWLAAGLMLTVVFARPRISGRRALIALASVGIATVCGLTSCFTQPLRSPFVAASGGVRAGDWFGQVLLSTPMFFVVLGMLIVAAASYQSARSGVRFAGRPALLLGGAALFGVVGGLVPTAYRPAPAAALLPLTLLGAYLVGEGLSRFLRPTYVPLGAGALVLLAAAAAYVGGGQPPIVHSLNGMVAVSRVGDGVRLATDRIRSVSYELYSLDRTLDEPRGGRSLKVQVAPELSEWARWYLRDFTNFRDAPQPAGWAEVRIVPADGAAAPAVQPQESFGAGESAVTIVWSRSVWSKIDATAAGRVAQLKDQYGLFDAPPPGNRPGQFNNPSDIARDPAGNFYVVDQGNSRVQKFDPRGRYLLMWGAKGEGDGQFGDMGAFLGPTGIVATNQFVWVADTWNHRIQQFRPDGAFVRAWGSYLNLYEEGKPAADLEAHTDAFYGPRGLALGPDKLLYVTDTGNKRVLVYDQNGGYVRQWGAPGTGPAQLDEPVGVAVSQNGRVYIADGRNARIQVFDLRGAPQSRWRVAEFADEGRLEPYVDVDAEGDVYVSEPAASRVAQYTPSGELVVGYEGSTDVQLLTPVGLSVAPNGKVYIVDSALGRVIHLNSMR